MKTKIKFLIIAILFFLVFSTICFASSENPSLISTRNEITNQIVNDETSPDTAESIDKLPDEIQSLIDNEDNSISLDEIEGMEEDYYDDMDSDLDYINEDYYLVSDNIELKKDVNGNVYLIGDKVNIKSTEIVGNVFIIADEVNISSDIYMSLYVMAGSINIESGEILDTYIMADKVNIGQEAIIDRDAKILSNKLNMDGTIYKNLYSMSQDTNINGTVEGKLTYTGNLIEGENSSINEIKKIEVKKENNNNIKERFDSIKTALQRLVKIWKIVTGSIIILVIFLLTQNSLNIKGKTEGDKEYYYSDKSFTTDDILNIVKGIIYLVACIIAIIILFFTVIGIPVGVLLLLVYIFTIFLSTYVACIEIAKSIKIKTDSKGKLKTIIVLLAIALYILVEILATIPSISFIVTLLVTLYGLGAIVNFIFFRKNKNTGSSINKNSSNIENKTNNNQTPIVYENDKTIENNDNNNSEEKNIDIKDNNEDNSENKNEESMEDNKENN